MNPLQIATITASLAPIAGRSLTKLADIFTLGGDSPHAAASDGPEVKPTGTSDWSNAGVRSRFSQLYQKLTTKLQSLLGQVPQLDGSESSIQVAVESDGKLILESEDPSVDLQSIQDWLNQDPQLNALASDTLDAKQDADWSSGLANFGATSNGLYLRIQTNNSSPGKQAA